MVGLIPLHSDHSRRFHENRYVYPVVSRRSAGVSIGINLNPDKVCNFDCIYCQVDRRSEAETTFVGTEILLAELDQTLELIASGKLWEDAKFAATPPALRRLNDIAFSGDGEPTTFRNFDLIVGEVAQRKKVAGLNDVKLVLITNATMFHRPACARGLSVLMANNGEIWAKLDAGTEEYYHLIERTKIPFSRVLENIRDVALRWPVVIQALFMRVEGTGPSEAEINAWISRLRDILEAGGKIALAQVYTVARPPAEAVVTPLADADVDGIAARVRDELSIPASAYYGVKS
ncbi:MAG: radical SAM protein [Planctomyces sp.]|nr:radical SAM protein [Planctomyces sp.]